MPMKTNAIFTRSKARRRSSSAFFPAEMERREQSARRKEADPEHRFEIETRDTLQRGRHIVAGTGAITRTSSVGGRFCSFRYW